MFWLVAKIPLSKIKIGTWKINHQNFILSGQMEK